MMFSSSQAENFKILNWSLRLSMVAYPLVVIFPLDILTIINHCNFDNNNLLPISQAINIFEFIPMLFLQLFTIVVLFLNKERQKIKTSRLERVSLLAATMSAMTVIFKISSAVTILIYANLTFEDVYCHRHQIANELINTSPFIFLMVMMLALRKIFRKSLFNEKETQSNNTGNFGSAAWSSAYDLETMNAYSQNNGILIGADEYGRLLYLPLHNKLTISPAGGGKTSASSILMLLMHKGPIFAWDIKGELWATTIRCRVEVMKRKVIVIDPYGVTTQEDFSRGKSKTLLNNHSINPFDWIPEDRNQRDRMINTFASSLIIDEGSYAKHFDENAKILIRGYIDYIMSLPKEQRNLLLLYQLMSESYEDAKATFDQMEQLQGRAGAAANQINRVGADERGSILSTAYRQIDWLGDSNIQKVLSHSNFDLREFLSGNMDIFIILPEDQVKEQNRLVRMILALLMGLIVNAKPSELPRTQIVLLLEELPQFGYCPDVEQCIEVLRARGVIVWLVFQTLNQIEMFKKPDLFKGAPLKQIFTTDDTKTMEWIQQLGGKKTVLSKTFSNNKGDTSQKMQIFGGSVSRGEAESIQETGVDLITINKIRELNKDWQFVFLHGAKPIYCKKVRYFEEQLFNGLWDPNPLEVRN